MDSLMRIGRTPRTRKPKKKRFQAPRVKSLKGLAALRNARADTFYQSDIWLRLRYRVLVKYGPRCQACGAAGLNIRLHVDHIKPRSRFPDLALSESNLQVLCEACNLGKSNWDETDWRATP